MVKVHQDRLIVYWTLINETGFEPEEEDLYNEEELEKAIAIMQNSLRPEPKEKG